MKSPRALVMAALVVASAPVARAQDPLVTDRPDFTESSAAVATGVVQLEAGATFVDETSVQTVDAGEALVRWGLVDGLELRLGLGAYRWVNQPGADTDGVVDGSVGIKLDLLGSADRVLGGVESAVIVATTVPWGATGLSDEAWHPSAVLAASWELERGFGLGTNLGVGRAGPEGEELTQWWLSAALSAPLAQRMAGFLEVYAFSEERPDGPETATLQAGVTYLVTDDLQLDARVARRLTGEGPDLLLGCGVSWRFGGGG